MLLLGRVNFGLFAVLAGLGAEVNWRRLTLAFAAGEDPTLA